MKKIAIFLSLLVAVSLIGCKDNKERRVDDEEEAEEVVQQPDMTVYIGNFNMTERPDWLATRELTYSDLSNLNKDELRLLRNAVFAIHNRRFQSDDLADYFAMFQWYSPLYQDYEIYLNSTETNNVNTIQRYENRY